MDYEMTEKQYKTLMDACKPVPYMIFGGMEPPSPQQNANDAWASLGKELNFDSTTVKPIQEKSTNGSNTRRTTKYMYQLRNGLGALYDFMEIRTKRRAFS